MSETTKSAAFPRRAGKATAMPGEGAHWAVRPLLLAAAVLTAASIRLPLWGMTLVSTQYPDGLRMIVYPTQIRGDVTEINVLNHYIGMHEITNAFFAELKILPLLFGVIAAACVLAAIVRRAWTAAVPLAMMAATAGYGMWAMQHRLWQFGHELDPHAAIQVPPFSPPMFGQNQLAQFATWSYFSWGTFFPMIAGAMVAVALWLEVRGGRQAKTLRVPRAVPAAAMAVLAGMILVSGGCARERAPAPSIPVLKPGAVTPADQELQRITARWSDAAYETCGPPLQDALGARELVRGALNVRIRDEDEQVVSLRAEARAWAEKADARLGFVRPQLESGICDGELNVALDEVTQTYARAGTAAMQALRLAQGFHDTPRAGR
ncbi:MAG TPA: hypothetical protein VF771_18420 [Longimicrobiaceae bacterium]